jgi:hypothetical protein
MFVYWHVKEHLYDFIPLLGGKIASLANPVPGSASLWSKVCIGDNQKVVHIVTIHCRHVVQ